MRFFARVLVYFSSTFLHYICAEYGTFSFVLLVIEHQKCKSLNFGDEQICLMCKKRFVSEGISFTITTCVRL